MASLVWLLGTVVVLAQPPALAGPSQKVIALYKQGTSALEAKDFNQAIAAFTEIIALEPGAARAYLGRAIAYHRSGNLDKALADYEQVSRLSKNVQALVNQGGILAEKRQYEKALAAYTEALQLDPAIMSTYYRRALVYEQLGDYAKALADYEAILRRTPGNPYLYTCRGNLHAHARQYAEAVQDYQAALAQSSNQADTCNCLAWLLATCPLREIRDGPKAVYYARKACELTHWKVDIYIDTLAAAFAETGNFSEAVRCEQQALATAKESDWLSPQMDSSYRLVTMIEKDRAEAQQRLKLYEQQQAYRQP